ncbi:MAG: L,D-transpeptidase family protein [Firmicutes bacterium]|nr:L,D-transpeptidase family protein [Bacillota bacterium]
MRIIIHKGDRTLHLQDGDRVLLAAPIALGRVPQGAKTHEGDGKTPEGVYAVCLVKPDGKFGRSLGVSYPSLADARAALAAGAIGGDAFQAITDALDHGRRPPWGTALGGEIYIHEGGADGDWTEGCIALNEADMDVLFPHRALIESVEILP